MGLYDKYARLAGERLQFSDNGLTPFGTCIDEVYSATEGRIGNKKVILAGTNNYLGLTFNHDAISEGQAALAAQGTGTTGSRMANGSYAPHLALEKEIAEFFNRPTAIVFSTGYTANLGVISALADHNAVVLLDADSHASIYDACSLGARKLFVSAITMLKIWNGAWFASVNGRKRRLSSLRASTACSVTLRRWRKLLISNVVSVVI